MFTPFLRGACLIASGAIILSTFGLMIRFINAASPWELVFWRSVGIVLAVSAMLLARHRRNVLVACRDAGATALAGGVCLAGAFIFFILAITSTTVGSALFTMSVSPFVAAVLGWIVLGERVHLRTWLAATLAFAGVAIMFIGGIAGGDARGQVFALAVAVCGAGYMVVLRRGRDVDMTVTVALGGLFSLLFAAVPAWPLDTPLRDVAIALSMGVLQNAVGQAMIAAGSRDVPAAQIALLMLIEVVLGPFWVWLTVGEMLTLHTLVGGAVILVAIAGDALANGRSAGKPAAPATPFDRPEDMPPPASCLIRQ